MMESAKVEIAEDEIGSFVDLTQSLPIEAKLLSAPTSFVLHRVLHGFMTHGLH